MGLIYNRKNGNGEEKLNDYCIELDGEEYIGGDIFEELTDKNEE